MVSLKIVLDAGVLNLGAKLGVCSIKPTVFIKQEKPLLVG